MQGPIPQERKVCGKGYPERVKNYTISRRDAEIWNKQLLYFLFGLCVFAPLREMILFVLEFFHAFPTPFLRRLL